MKKFSILFLLVTLFGQIAITDINGYGKEYKSLDPAAISIGESWLYSNRYNKSTFNALSSLISLDMTSISMFSSFGKISTNNEFQQSKQSIDLFNFSFPFKKNNVISIGVSPLTESDFIIIDNDLSVVPGNEFSEPIAYSNKYDIIGGVSQLQIGFSSKIHDQYSFGIKWNKLFGNQFSYHTNYIYSISYNILGEGIYNLSDSSFSYTANKFNGSIIDLDGRKQFNKNSSVSFLLSLSLPISILTTQSINSVQSDSQIFNFYNMHLKRFALGYTNMFNNKTSYIIEWHYINSNKGNQELMILNQNSPTVHSLHCGFFGQIINFQSSLMNSASLGIGMNVKRIELNDINSYDFSMSLGTSINYANNSNFVDLSFQIGNIFNPNKFVDSQYYTKINLGITAGDLWFSTKRREN